MAGPLAAEPRGFRYHVRGDFLWSDQVANPLTPKDPGSDPDAAWRSLGLRRLRAQLVWTVGETSLGIVVRPDASLRPGAARVDTRLTPVAELYRRPALQLLDAYDVQTRWGSSLTVGFGVREALIEPWEAYPSPAEFGLKILAPQRPMQVWLDWQASEAVEVELGAFRYGPPERLGRDPQAPDRAPAHATAYVGTNAEASWQMDPATAVRLVGVYGSDRWRGTKTERVQLGVDVLRRGRLDAWMTRAVLGVRSELASFPGRHVDLPTQLGRVWARLAMGVELDARTQVLIGGDLGYLETVSGTTGGTLAADEPLPRLRPRSTWRGKAFELGVLRTYGDSLTGSFLMTQEDRILDGPEGEQPGLATRPPERLVRRFLLQLSYQLARG